MAPRNKAKKSETATQINNKQSEDKKKQVKSKLKKDTLQNINSVDHTSTEEPKIIGRRGNSKLNSNAKLNVSGSTDESNLENRPENGEPIIKVFASKTNTKKKPSTKPSKTSKNVIELNVESSNGIDSIPVAVASKENKKRGKRLSEALEIRKAEEKSEKPSNARKNKDESSVSAEQNVEQPSTSKAVPKRKKTEETSENIEVEAAVQHPSSSKAVTKRKKKDETSEKAEIEAAAQLPNSSKIASKRKKKEETSENIEVEAAVQHPSSSKAVTKRKKKNETSEKAEIEAAAQLPNSPKIASKKKKKEETFEQSEVEVAEQQPSPSKVTQKRKKKEETFEQSEVEVAEQQPSPSKVNQKRKKKEETSEHSEVEVAEQQPSPSKVTQKRKKKEETSEHSEVEVAVQEPSTSKTAPKSKKKEETEPEFTQPKRTRKAAANAIIVIKKLTGYNEEESSIEKNIVKIKKQEIKTKTKNNAKVAKTEDQNQQSPVETTTAKKRIATKRSSKTNEIVVDTEEPTTSKIAKKSVKTKKDDKPKMNAISTDYSTINFKTDKKFNLKITSWNVAGLRAIVSKQGFDYFQHEKPNIICLQEIKCLADEVPQDAKIDGYHPYWFSKPGGRGGVAIYSKIMPYNVEYGLGNEEMDDEGRIITAEYEKFFIICVYVPNAGRKLVTMPRRLRWNKMFEDHVQKLNKKKPIIICGDMNVAHNEIDLANPKTNTKNAGFTPEERDGMTNLLSLGFTDAFRYLYPTKDKTYSFWSYMGNARSKNVGWRLDYFINSERINSSIVDCFMRPEVMGSDHCPINLLLNF